MIQTKKLFCKKLFIVLLVFALILMMTLTENDWQITQDMAKNIQLSVEKLEDHHKLIDLDNFEFSIRPKSCNNLNNSPIVVVFVVSAPKNEKRRMTIRETWGQDDARAYILFMLAATEPEIQDEIEKESAIYGDVVQGNFIDAYKNLTYKYVMGFKWFLENCKDVKYLLKVDDDVLVNSPLLFKYLAGNAPNNSIF
jgi:hypothetical protein